jgi:hypothetical protein
MNWPVNPNDKHAGNTKTPILMTASVIDLLKSKQISSAAKIISQFNMRLKNGQASIFLGSCFVIIVTDPDV